MEKAVSMRLKEVFDALDASPDGLTSEEAETLLKKYGLNTLIEKKNRRFSYKFLSSLVLIAVLAEEIRKFFSRRLSKNY